MLADLLHGCGQSVRYCDHIIGVGKTSFEAVREAWLDGMVAKRLGSAYAGVLTTTDLNPNACAFTFRDRRMAFECR